VYAITCWEGCVLRGKCGADDKKLGMMPDKMEEYGGQGFPIDSTMALGGFADHLLAPPRPPQLSQVTCSPSPALKYPEGHFTQLPQARKRLIGGSTAFHGARKNACKRRGGRRRGGY